MRLRRWSQAGGRAGQRLEEEPLQEGLVHDAVGFELWAIGSHGRAEEECGKVSFICESC